MGAFYVPGHQQVATCKDVARAVYARWAAAAGGAVTSSSERHVRSDPRHDHVDSHIAVLEIDTATCAIRLSRKFVTAEDCGRLINR